MKSISIQRLDGLAKEYLEKYNAIISVIRMMDIPVANKHEAIIRTVKKKKHHNGLHWTQKPENKAKLRAMLIRANKKRNESK